MKRVSRDHLTGRIDAAPSAVWNEEVLEPQFAYEVEHLLRHYVAIEMALLLEYVRMDVVPLADAAAIAARLDGASPTAIRADRVENMSDISFALERHVAAGLPELPPAWHVDRSRNDFQACAQLMAARDQVVRTADALLAVGRAAMGVAERTAEVPMPGYTHSQAAQIISPGFYFAALSAETLDAARRLLRTYDEVDASPLGSGTMAGQELPWDRDRLATVLGFAKARPHALVAVASRGWALSIGMDLAAYAVTLSRFATDLMAWGGSEYGFLELPDELSGISAAMPQKRNFPVLERIRGRCAHVAGCAFDLAQGQRNTSYTNTVEVSKEAGAHLRTQFDALRSALRLTLAVVNDVSFRADRMYEVCEREYLGGFTLANRLTLDSGIPWRTAQVIAGRYVKQALERGIGPAEPDGALLTAIAADQGWTVADPAALLTATLDVHHGLRAKRSAGSTHPDAVAVLLADQRAEYAELTAAWAARRTAAAAADSISALFQPAAAPAGQ